MQYTTRKTTQRTMPWLRAAKSAASAMLLALALAGCEPGPLLGPGLVDAGVPWDDPGDEGLPSRPNADPVGGAGAGPAPAVDLPDLPPIAGGNIAVDARGTRAVVADADRRRVMIFDVSSQLEPAGWHGRVPVFSRALPDALPGRVVMDDAHGRAYVALGVTGDDPDTRGEILVLDVARGVEVERRPACADPRGLAVEGETLHVVCRGGKWLRFTADGAIRETMVETDLRDIVPRGDGRYWISLFRTAEILEVDAEGTVHDRIALPATDPAQCERRPATAWRMIGTADGGVAVLHTLMMIEPFPGPDERPPNGYYRGAPINTDVGCAFGPVAIGLTFIDDDGAARLEILRRGVLAVDVAGGPDDFTVAAPGTNGRTLVKGGDPADTPLQEADCRSNNGPYRNGQFVAVGGSASGVRVAWSREPPGLCRLSGESAEWIGADVPALDPVRNFGHELFHRDPVGGGRMGIACASCHPEGLDDGHVWTFPEFGPRRTQSLVGGLRGTEPLHWGGELPSMRELTDQVMHVRMGRNQPLTDAEVDVLLDWLDRLPARRVDRVLRWAAVERGRVIFEDPVVGCATCHQAADYQAGRAHDVGTGGRFQTPSLVGVGLRRPLMHDGCAESMAARFDPDLRREDGTACGGDTHGNLDHLEPDELGDLIEYVRSL